MATKKSTTIRATTLLMLFWLCQVQTSWTQDTTAMATDTTIVDTLQLLDGININDVEVIKAFEATLIDAQPVGLAPAAPRVPDLVTNYQYQVTIVPLDLEYPDPVIKPYAMRPDPPKVVYQHFVEAGYGSVNNPHIAAGFSTAKDDSELKILAGYDALDNTTEVPLQEMYRAYADIAVSKDVNTSHRLSLRAHGDLGQYGIYNQILLSAPGGGLQYKRDLNRLSGSVQFTTREPLKGWQYSTALETNVTLSAIDLLDNFDSEELFGRVRLRADRSTDSDVSYGIGGSGWINDTGQPDGDHLAAIVSPYFKLHKDQWWVRLGADAFIAEQQHFWPAFEAGVDIRDGQYIPYIGSSLRTKVQNNYNVTDYNRFATLNNSTTTVLRSIYGGIRGQVGQISYEGEASYQQVDDHIFFNLGGGVSPNTLLIEDIIFLDCNIVAIKGHVDFQLTEKVSVGGTLRQRVFDFADDTEKAWGQPLFELGANASIKLLKEKLTIQPSLDLATVAQYDIVDNPANALADLSVAGSYSIGKRWQLYFHANNLLDNAYIRWPTYPTVGINVDGGVRVKF